jgi:hypothetical protein
MTTLSHALKSPSFIKTGVGHRGKTAIGWTKNKHCWSYDLTSLTIVRTTYMSFSATAVFSWPEGKYAYMSIKYIAGQYSEK